MKWLKRLWARIFWPFYPFIAKVGWNNRWAVIRCRPSGRLEFYKYSHVAMEHYWDEEVVTYKTLKEAEWFLWHSNIGSGR